MPITLPSVVIDLKSKKPRIHIQSHNGNLFATYYWLGDDGVSFEYRHLHELPGTWIRIEFERMLLNRDLRCEGILALGDGVTADLIKHKVPAGKAVKK